MGSKSHSSSANTTENLNFNNVDYGSGDVAAGIAETVNLSKSTLQTGDIGITTTDHGAIAAAGNVVSLAIDRNAQSIEKNTGRLLDSVDGVAKLAFTDTAQSREFSYETSKLLADKLSETTRDALQGVSQSTDRALAFARQATRSEAGQIAENLTKYVMIGGGLLLAVVLFMGATSK